VRWRRSCKKAIRRVGYLGKLYKPMKDLSRMTDTVTQAAVGLLDEPSSALDAESEALVFDALARLAA
jgi:energy-coupling factor transporter ATP-binding protein EcfA2